RSLESTSEAILSHAKQQESLTKNVQRTTDDTRQFEPNTGKANAEQGTQQSTKQPSLGTPHEDGTYLQLPYLVGDPGLLCTISKRSADTKQHLCQHNGLEARNGAFKNEACTDQEDAKYNRQASAIDIGENARWDLAQETHNF